MFFNWWYQVISEGWLWGTVEFMSCKVHRREAPQTHLQVPASCLGGVRRNHKTNCIKVSQINEISF